MNLLLELIWLHPIHSGKVCLPVSQVVFGFLFGLLLEPWLLVAGCLSPRISASPGFLPVAEFSFMPLWPEKTLDLTSTLLNLLRLALYPDMWSVLENVPWALEMKFNQFLNEIFY